MDDRFLSGLRRDPPERFTGRLRERLRRMEEEDVEQVPRRGRLVPWLAGAVAAAAAIALFLVPSVRVAAQSVLDLFRVRTFAAVPFDEARLEKVRQLAGMPHGKGEDSTPIGVEKMETLKEPGPPTFYPTPGAGAAAARLPGAHAAGWLPAGMSLDSVMVRGEGAARFTIATGRLRAVLDGLDLHDVAVPSELEGQHVTVRMPPALIQSFRSERRREHLIQSTSPEVTLPPGADLARLGEIGLRILGLDAGEARRMAHAVDWRTTLLVPVPVDAASFRQVTVRGHSGLLILSSGRSAEGRPAREGSLLLWTEGDRVLALGGDLHESEVMQVAESLR